MQPAKDLVEEELQMSFLQILSGVDDVVQVLETHTADRAGHNTMG